MVDGPTFGKTDSAHPAALKRTGGAEFFDRFLQKKLYVLKIVLHFLFLIVFCVLYLKK